MKFAILAAGILIGVPSWAHAYCSEPSVRLSVPDAPGAYGRPSVPYCLSSYKWSGKHECDSWELDSYQRDIDEYVTRLNTYVEEANELARKAKRYADEAYGYAVCEAREASSQHQ